MNKKLLNVSLLAAMLAAAPATFVSCDDYDDDIDHLQEQIDAQKATLDEIQKLLAQGAVIKDVEQNGSGIKLTLSNGKEYILTNGKDGQNGKDGINGQNGKDGINGQDGKDADVWTISTDGYWLRNGEYFMIDGVKAKAIGVDGAVGPQGPKGEDGKDGINGQDGKDGKDGQDGKDGINGQDGKDGINGQDGKDGKYYVPNAETGFFEIWQNGEKIEDTKIAWRGTGISAVLIGNELRLSGVDGAENDVVVYAGRTLSSIAYIPERVDYYGQNFTSTFYVIPRYIEYDSKTDKRTSIPFNKSSHTQLNYRINPSDAYIPNEMPVKFINRTLATRAVGDKETMMNVEGYKHDKDVLHVYASLKPDFLNQERERNKIEKVALQAFLGQDQTSAITSDFINVDIDAAYGSLLKASTVNYKQPGDFYYGYQKVETVLASDTCQFNLVYNKTLDLNSLVGFKFVNGWGREAIYVTPEELGFKAEDFKVEFTLPETYLSEDGETNQQWFVQLENGVLSANSANLNNNLTSAINRTPVVRAEAFAKDAEGNYRSIASNYIKIEIVKEDIPEVKPEDIKHVISEAKTFSYSELKAENSIVGIMSNENINNILYGQTGLNSVDFWNIYGDPAFTLVVDGKNGEEDLTDNAVGVEVATPQNPSVTQSSEFAVGVNNKVKTDITYKNVDGKGAHYTVTIKIAPKAEFANQYSDIYLTQEFFVKAEREQIAFNKYYYDEATNTVAVKGLLVDGKWVQVTNVYEHIVAPYSIKNMVGSAEFTLPENEQNNKFILSAQGDLSLNKLLMKESEVATVQIAINMVNTESYSYDYNVKFINPFVGAEISTVELAGNKKGGVSFNAGNFVKVLDLAGKEIVTYDTKAKKLVLTEYAKKQYGENNVACVYKVEGLEIGNLENDAVDGLYHWDNAGSELIKPADFKVTATVKIVGVSVVKVTIPVQLTTAK